MNPVCEFWQVTADLPLATEVPAGHGHTYSAEYVDTWAAVLQPPGWTADRADPLRQIVQTGKTDATRLGPLPLAAEKIAREEAARADQRQRECRSCGEEDEEMLVSSLFRKMNTTTRAHAGDRLATPIMPAELGPRVCSVALRLR